MGKGGAKRHRKVLKNEHVLFLSMQAHPKAKRFKDQGCPECEKLGVIFGLFIGTKKYTAKENNQVNLKEENIQRKSQVRPWNHEPDDSLGGDQPSVAVLKQAERKFTVTECLDILDAMDITMSRRTYLQAVKKFQKEGWREGFLHMSDARRKELVLSIEDGVAL